MLVDSSMLLSTLIIKIRCSFCMVENIPYISVVLPESVKHIIEMRLLNAKVIPVIFTMDRKICYDCSNVPEKWELLLHSKKKKRYKNDNIPTQMRLFLLPFNKNRKILLGL